MAVDTAVDSRKLTATTTDKYAALGGPPADALYMHTPDTDVVVEFGRATDATSFLLPEDVVVEFNFPCNQVHYKSGGSSTLYLLAVRRNTR